MSTVATRSWTASSRSKRASWTGSAGRPILNKMQQIVHDKVLYAPIWQLAFLNGVGPRVQESGLGLIPGHAYSAPYEDLKLR